jgi:hypothetical protein
MSAFDPSVPANVPPGSNLDFNETTFDFRRNNISKVLRASATASASVTITDTNYDARGLIAFFNIATFPGSASTTVALKIRAVDPATGGLYTLCTQAARSATGLSTLVIYPGMTAAANSSTSMAAPRDLSFLLSMSSGATSKSCIMSLGVQYLK